MFDPILERDPEELDLEELAWVRFRNGKQGRLERYSYDVETHKSDLLVYYTPEGQEILYLPKHISANGWNVYDPNTPHEYDIMEVLRHA